MSRAFTGRHGNRLVASEIGPPRRPVLLLHGGGQTRHAWARTARLLAEHGWHAVAIGASLGGIASLLALGAPGEPVLAGLVLVDVVPRMDPGGLDHIQGFMR